MKAKKVISGIISIIDCLVQWFLTWGKFTPGVNLLNRKLQPMQIFINGSKLYEFVNFAFSIN